MALQVTKHEVWAGDLRDQPGDLARVLTAIGTAGGDLECVIARRQPDAPGMGVVFVTPVKGKKVQQAAVLVGLCRAENIATLRVEGPDKPGLGGQMMSAIGDAGINVRGVTSAVLGNKFVAYIGFDSDAEAATAAKALKGVGGAAKKR
ncbi:MAG: amino acid-binding protein [Planctomycetes bacterium]|nr:amino acid-binding protein [Planctomycetota bacterium]